MTPIVLMTCVGKYNLFTELVTIKARGVALRKFGGFGLSRGFSLIVGLFLCIFKLLSQ